MKKKNQEKRETTIKLYLFNKNLKLREIVSNWIFMSCLWQRMTSQADREREREREREGRKRTHGKLKCDTNLCQFACWVETIQTF